MYSIWCKLAFSSFYRLFFFFLVNSMAVPCAKLSFLIVGWILPVVPPSIAHLRGDCHSWEWARALPLPTQFQACFRSCSKSWNSQRSCWRPQNPAWMQLYAATEPSALSFCRCSLVTPKCLVPTLKSAQNLIHLVTQIILSAFVW